MPDNIEKGDIRSKKTDKALVNAMRSLLSKHNFKRITVSDICEESVISRATFYARFTDKYNFLKWWMMAVWPENIVNKDDLYEVKEKKVNGFIAANKLIIKNLLLDADRWTLDVLFDVLHSILRLTTEKTIAGVLNPKYIVLSNFYIGGMIQYILWQVQNNFPQNVHVMNECLFEMINSFQRWM